jgi:hypothetical protein
MDETELKRLVIINATRYVVGFPQCAGGCVFLQPDVATCSHDGFTECGEPELRLRGELAAAILALLYEHGARKVEIKTDEAKSTVDHLCCQGWTEIDGMGMLHLTQLGELLAHKNQANGYHVSETI